MLILKKRRKKHTFQSKNQYHELKRSIFKGRETDLAVLKSTIGWQQPARSKREIGNCHWRRFSVVLISNESTAIKSFNLLQPTTREKNKMKITHQRIKTYEKKQDRNDTGGRNTDTHPPREWGDRKARWEEGAAGKKYKTCNYCNNIIIIIMTIIILLWLVESVVNPVQVCLDDWICSFNIIRANFFPSIIIDHGFY